MLNISNSREYSLFVMFTNVEYSKCSVTLDILNVDWSWILAMFTNDSHWKPSLKVYITNIH